MKLIFPDHFITYQEAMKWFECVELYNKGKENINISNNEDIEKIIVLEHKDVYTAGKSIDNNEEKNISTIHGIPAIHTKRGGLWTWHGKGQIVIYFIYNIKKRYLPLNNFMTLIENVVVENTKQELEKNTEKLINSLCIENKNTINNINYNIFSNNQKRGFWYNKYDTKNTNNFEKNEKQNKVFNLQNTTEILGSESKNTRLDIDKNVLNNNDEKFGFIGLRVSNGFVYHGISINYNNDLKWFDYINPCGLGDIKITSIQQILFEKLKFLDKAKINSILDINNFKLNLGKSLFNVLNKIDFNIK